MPIPAYTKQFESDTKWVKKRGKNLEKMKGIGPIWRYPLPQSNQLTLWTQSAKKHKLKRDR
jgi:hypothetical protein